MEFSETMTKIFIANVYMETYTVKKNIRNFTVKSTGSWDARESTVILQRLFFNRSLYLYRKKAVMQIPVFLQ
jgi:hypothetical protein